MDDDDDDGDDDDDDFGTYRTLLTHTGIVHSQPELSERMCIWILGP